MTARNNFLLLTVLAAYSLAPAQPGGDPVLNTLGFLMHDGGHGTVPADYPVYIEFIKKHLISNH